MKRKSGVELIDIFGKKPNGQEDFLGRGPMPPVMKFADLRADYGLSGIDLGEDTAASVTGAMLELVNWMQTQGWMPPPMIVHQGPMTYAQRLTDVIALLCREVPPAELVAAWINRGSGDHRLQEWACERAPSWAQGIGLLDAAHVMADQPEEGVEHEPAPKTDVRSILLDIVPGDGSGAEVYARSVGDVVNKLTELSQEVDSLHGLKAELGSALGLLSRFVERVRDLEDKGPAGETWQSDELLKDIADADALLAKKDRK